MAGLHGSLVAGLAVGVSAGLLLSRFSRVLCWLISLSLLATARGGASFLCPKRQRNEAKKALLTRTTLSVHSVQFLFIGAPKARCSPEPRMCETLFLRTRIPHASPPVTEPAQGAPRAIRVEPSTEFVRMPNHARKTTRGTRPPKCVRPYPTKMTASHQLDSQKTEAANTHQAVIREAEPRISAAQATQPSFKEMEPEKRVRPCGFAWNKGACPRAYGAKRFTVRIREKEGFTHPWLWRAPCFWGTNEIKTARCGHLVFREVESAFFASFLCRFGTKK